MKPKKRKVGGAILIEAMLVMVPYLAFTLGSMEFMWFLHVRQSLNAAANAAVLVVGIDHNEIPPGNSSGASPKSLDAFTPGGTLAGQTVLSTIGFSSNFISQVDFNINYINDLSSINPRLQVKGIPQKEGMRLIGAMLTIPWSEAMIFGNITAGLLNIVTTPPATLSTTAMMWKQWKKAA